MNLNEHIFMIEIHILIYIQNCLIYQDLNCYLVNIKRKLIYLGFTY